MGIRASTETKLLDAAEELFFTHGIQSTSIDAVLARAGVSAATLYRGFASKDALVAAALNRRHNAWIGVWNRAIAERITPHDRLLSVFAALDEFHGRPDASRWCAFLGSAAEYATPPEEIARSVARDTETLRAGCFSSPKPSAAVERRRWQTSWCLSSPATWPCIFEIRSTRPAPLARSRRHSSDARRAGASRPPSCPAARDSSRGPVHDGCEAAWPERPS
jgi:AcrR family transcriptional regulator